MLPGTFPAIAPSVITAKARENAITSSRLRAMAGQSCNELLSHFPAPAPVGALLDSALAQAIETALKKIPVGKDATVTTAKYVLFLQECGRELADDRLTWSPWVKLTKEEPAKASLADAQPVVCAAQRYEEHPRLRADIEQYTQSLFAFAARALTLYQECKGERGLLDFVDLEQLTLGLMQQSAVAEVIREEFDLLVVDEFQDTNPIQLALFIGLAARYVTDEQRGRQPIFIATLWAVASWLFFRVARSTRMIYIRALRSRLEKLSVFAYPLRVSSQGRRRLWWHSHRRGNSHCDIAV